MPLITIRSAAAVSDEAVDPLLSACSAALAETLAQPEAYVMTLFERSAGMTMAGTSEPCGLVEVRSVVELVGDQTQAVTGVVCALLGQHLGVPPERIFVNFTDFRRAMWGFNGATLA